MCIRHGGTDDFNFYISECRHALYTSVGSNFFMKSSFYIILGLLLGGCFSKKETNDYGDWRDKFVKQESYRIVETMTHFQFINNKYVKQTESVSFKTFDSSDRLIGENDRHFYEYNSKGNVSKESYCGRTCEIPFETIHIYDSVGQLTELKSLHPNMKGTIVDRIFKYNSAGQLVTEISTPGERQTTIEHTYNPDSTKSSTTRTEFNTNVNSWLTYYDKFFYNSSKQLTKQEYRMKDKDLVKISTYKYDNGLETQRVDTTITSIPGYQLDLSKNVGHHAYYGKEELKYDIDGRVIEKIIYRPDYKTPSSKWTYEYKKTG